MGFVNRHLAGFIAFKVRARGTFDEVPAPGGGTCGKWSEPRSGGNGQTRWNCDLKLFGQTLTASFYESSHGVLQFRLYPGRVYIDPARVSLQKAADYMMSRAKYVAALMKTTGWQITDPCVKGVWHTAKDRDPLAKLLDAGHNDENEDIIVDTSPGYPETEMEHGGDNEELVRIYANMPSAIKAASVVAEGAAAKAEGALARADDAVGKADLMLAELSSLQQVLAAQTKAIETLAGNVTALAEVQARFATMSMAQIQGQVRDAIRSFDGRGYA